MISTSLHFERAQTSPNYLQSHRDRGRRGSDSNYDHVSSDSFAGDIGSKRKIETEDRERLYQPRATRKIQVSGGLRIKNGRIKVDVERDRTVKGWKPTSLGRHFIAIQHYSPLSCPEQHPRIPRRARPRVAQLLRSEAVRNPQVRVEASSSHPNQVPFYRLYVGNTHFSITGEDLRGDFSPFGELEFVQLQWVPKMEHGCSSTTKLYFFTEPNFVTDPAGRAYLLSIGGRAPSISGLEHSAGELLHSPWRIPTSLATVLVSVYDQKRNKVQYRRVVTGLDRSISLAGFKLCRAEQVCQPESEGRLSDGGALGTKNPHILAQERIMVVPANHPDAAGPGHFARDPPSPPPTPNPPPSGKGKFSDGWYVKVWDANGWDAGENDQCVPPDIEGLVPHPGFESPEWGDSDYWMRVTLLDGRQMTDQMLAFDKHMNLVLADTEEYRKNKRKQTRSGIAR
ncbi:hypothetical protein V8F33_010129 [Rhypophila sp. PSN 637]